MIRAHTLHFFEFYSEKNGIFGHFQRFVKIFFSKIKIFFVEKESLGIGLWHPRATAPYMHPDGTFCYFLFFWKLKKNIFFRKIFKIFEFCAFGCTYWGCQRGLKNFNMWPITYFDLSKNASVDQKLWTIENWVRSRPI